MVGVEEDDVVDVVGTVVVCDVDGGVVSAVEVGGVVDVTVDHIVELFKFPIVQPSVNSQQEKDVLFFVCLTEKVKCSVTIPQASHSD